MTAIIGTSAETAIKWLKEGEPVALPTETVYGLAAPLSLNSAIEKVFSLKQRPFQNPLIVHVLNIDGLQNVAEVNSSALNLAKHFWPGPLTFVLKKKNCVPPIVSAGQPTVAVRCPSAPLFREVLTLLGEPLVAPSANKFQHVSPTMAQHVYQDMGDILTYILDGGPCTFGLESTILSLLDKAHPVLLRPGPITKEQLESILSVPIVDSKKTAINSDTKPHLSPGLYKKHYSPQTPLYLVQSLEYFIPSPQLHSVFTKNAAHVFLYPPQHALKPNEFVLSPHHSLQEAAAHLFQCLQTLDHQSWSSIWIEKPPSSGLGQAMTDRLSRAAHFDLL